jgi:hypothetical protein
MGEALVEELERAPNVCWLFCPPLPGLEEMIKGVCEGAGTDQLIGCTTSGEISSGGLSLNSAVLGGLASDTVAFEIVTVRALEKDSMAAGRQLAASFSSAPRYLQVFSDGLTGNGCAILRGIADVLGANVPVSGGAAGDNGDFVKTLQFGRNRIYSDAVCAIGFYGDFKLGTGVQSGWAPIGLAKQVTRARGKTVFELNGEPALNVYERFLGHHAKKLPAIGVEYPLGFTSFAHGSHEQGQYVLRATMSVDRKERSITFAGEIPEGAMVNLTCGDKTSILKAAEAAAKEARSAMGDALIEFQRKPAILSVARDLSARKQMEETLIRTERLSAVGEMAAGVAHNFNNLLQMIMGAGEAALAKLGTGEIRKSRDVLMTLIEGCHRGADIVRRIKDFTLIKTDHIDQATVFDLGKLVSEAVQLTKPMWANPADLHKYSLNFVKPLSALVKGNPSELYEVLVNVIKNALEAMPDGGQLAIAPEMRDGKIHLSISDTGIGIAEENLQRLFEPFFTTKGLKSSGLGLSSSYGIIKDLGLEGRL